MASTLRYGKNCPHTHFQASMCVCLCVRFERLLANISILWFQILANNLESKLREDLERLKKIRAHRGLRHYWG